MMLKAACQIAAHEEFAEDAMWCANKVEGDENTKGAAALRAMVVARRTETALMREVMGQLATVLARMPLERA
ncbi:MULTISPECIES: hypothetical protein [Methylobacteriaceae]|uniref:hypothetical protein n=1 Tax=Methylobacteriaceae TaxID=119045 RepID=UPI002F35AB1F